MIVCNLLVVVTYAYRVLLRNPSDQELPSTLDPSDDDDFTTPPPTSASTQSLTTVVLESSCTSVSELVGSFKSDFLSLTAHSSIGEPEQR